MMTAMAALRADGSGKEMTLHLIPKKVPADRPKRFVSVNRSQGRLDGMQAMVESLETDIKIEYIQIADPQINDQILAGMPDGMVVVNATGMGKDTPASPVTDAGVFPRPGCWGAANLTLTTRKRNTVHLSSGFSKMSANSCPRGANFPSG
jgi:shikimate 5-dehydrogenase